jgi:hypothetical protein
MIENGTRLTAIRRSRIAFWAVGSLVGLTTGVIASALTSTTQAIVIGVLTGLAVGLAVAVVLFCWPLIRVIWHWATELAALATFLACYLLLNGFVPWWPSLTILVVPLLAAFAIPPTRRLVLGWVWCAITRHRLRVCFAAFIATQQKGRTPLILGARPTPAGERVWIWLRPGLALIDLEARLDRLAAGCWAAECRIAPASRTYSALMRLDIARRDPLQRTITSPLPGSVPATILKAEPLPRDIHGLDLPDSPGPATPAPEQRTGRRAVTATPAAPDPDLSDLLPSRDGEGLSGQPYSIDTPNLALGGNDASSSASQGDPRSRRATFRHTTQRRN